MEQGLQPQEYSSMGVGLNQKSLNQGEGIV